MYLGTVSKINIH